MIAHTDRGLFSKYTKKDKIVLFGIKEGYNLGIDIPYKLEILENDKYTWCKYKLCPTQKIYLWLPG